ncbi:hypothetical protein Tco_0414862 [Tanacetum coccineum]
MIDGITGNSLKYPGLKHQENYRMMRYAKAFIAYHKEIGDTSSTEYQCYGPRYSLKLLKELLKEKTEQVQQMIRDQAKEYYENKADIQKKEEIWQSKESLLVRDLTDALKIIDQLRIEKERLEEQKDEEIRELNRNR